MANDRLGGAWRIEDTPTLVTLFICSALSLALFLSTLAKIPNAPGDRRSYRSTGTSAQPFPKTIPVFRLSGIQLGMTPIEVGSVHPSIHMSGPPAARQTGRFKVGNGDYLVSFMGPQAGRKSFRIHYQETFSDFSKMEIHDRLKEKFGPPAVNRCASETAITGWVCRLRWLMPGSVVLDAQTRSTLTAHGIRTIELEITALSRRTQAHGKNTALTRLQAISKAVRGM